MKQLKKMRDRAFINDCLRELRPLVATGKKIVLGEVARKVLTGAESSYYVSFDTAYRRIGPLLRGKGPRGGTLTMTQMLYRDLALHVGRTMERNPDMTIVDALTRVLEFGRASRHYISYQHALRLLRTLVRTNYELVE